jgi:hypothetical protein
MNEQYNQAMAELKELGHPGISEKKYNKKVDEVVYSDVENPVKDFKNTVVIEGSGWEHTVEIIEKMPQLDGEYILYFELKDEKLNFNDFCMVVLHIVQDRNKDNCTKITCTRNRSKDGKNHFWLLKK